jgi:hypothetical protein
MHRAGRSSDRYWTKRPGGYVRLRAGIPDYACPMSTDNRAAIDKALSALMDNYLSVVLSSQQIPFLSIRGFVVLILKYFLWALCLYVGLFILIANLLRWGYSRIRRRQYKKWGWAVIDTIRAPFVTLHQGEITAFKFLTLRGVVRILIYFRLNVNISSITRRLQESKVREYVQSGSGTFDPEWYGHRITLMKDLKDTVSNKLGVAFWSSLTGAAGVLGIFKAIYELVPAQVRAGLLAFLKSFLLTPETMENAPQLSESIQLTYFALLFVTYITWIVVTNFIVMRSTLKAARTYMVEREALPTIGVAVKREVPVDLIGATLLIACLMAGSYIAEASQTGSFSLAWDAASIFDIIGIIIVLCLPAYAGVRRYALNRAAIAR